MDASTPTLATLAQAFASALNEGNAAEVARGAVNTFVPDKNFAAEARAPHADDDWRLVRASAGEWRSAFAAYAEACEMTVSGRWFFEQPRDGGGAATAAVSGGGVNMVEEAGGPVALLYERFTAPAQAKDIQSFGFVQQWREDSAEYRDRLAIVRDQLAAARDPGVQISSDDIFSSDGHSTLQDFYELLVMGLLVDIMAAGKWQSADGEAGGADGAVDYNACVTDGANALLNMVATHELKGEYTDEEPMATKMGAFYSVIASPLCAQMGLGLDVASGAGAGAGAGACAGAGASRAAKRLTAGAAIAWLRAAIFAGALEGRNSELLAAGGDGEGGD